MDTVEKAEGSSGTDRLKHISITIDGHIIQCREGQLLLEIALDNGIYIPNLCHHPDLLPLGACRLCIVEMEGRQELYASCETKAEDGMVIITNSDRVMKVRRLAMELMLAQHPGECTDCPKYGKCEMQNLIQYLGVTNSRLRRTVNPRAVEKRNPLFVFDMVRCIKCGRCVRICHDVRGAKVLDYFKDPRQADTYVGYGDKLLLDTDCRFCGACAAVCPTGAVRDQEGLFEEYRTRGEGLVPCRAQCPIHIDVPRYVRYVSQDRCEDAIKVIREKTPFPRSLGDVCSHPCEAKCRRGAVNESVSICNIKRYASQKDGGSWKTSVKKSPDTGKNVAVIGAGPCGMTAAYYLSKHGHQVTIFESLPEAGGLMRFGIPEYRLPTEDIRSDVAEILETSDIILKTGTAVTDTKFLLDHGYDAVLIAIGNQHGLKPPVEGRELRNVFTDIDFLRQVRLGNKPEIGKRVVILGGGNVAFDCARTCVRLGVEEVYVVCLEARNAMVADETEIIQGQEEGIRLLAAHTLLRILGETCVTGVETIKVSSFYFDGNMQAVIEAEPGTERLIAADSVVFAVGQRPAYVMDFNVDRGRTGTIQVDDKLRTSQENVFAAGDVTYGTQSVVRAVASGRQAAQEIDIVLGGEGNIDECLIPPERGDPKIDGCEGFGKMVRDYPELSPVQTRSRSFTRATRLFTEEQARRESKRCLQCDLRLQITEPRFWSDVLNRGKTNG